MNDEMNRLPSVYPYTPADFMNMTPVKRLMTVRDYLAEHPLEHDQGHWARTSSTCGTTLCAAGTACLMAGGRLTSDEEIHYDDEESGPETVRYFHVVVRPDGQDLGVSEWAAQLLGLDEDQERLFYTTNNEFFDVADEIISENGE